MISPTRWELLTEQAASAAATLTTPDTDNPRAAWIYQHARHLAATVKPAPRADTFCTPAALLAWTVADRWHDVQHDAHDTAIFPGATWNELMQRWPMAVYARRLADHLAPLTGRVLELGAGVGNLTDRAAPRDAYYLVTDINERLARRTAQRHQHPWTRCDFDHEIPDTPRGWNTIIACNALHCAADPAHTIALIVDQLAPDGTLVIAEGHPGTPFRPWPLTWAFGIFDGWWDRGGFRADWTTLTEHPANRVPITIDNDQIGNIITIRKDDR